MNFEGISVFAAVTAGLISFLSPCVLPLVPGYVSFIAGNAADGEKDYLRTLSLSLCFVLGFSAVFIALGASTTLLSGLLLSYRTETAVIGGVLIIMFGLFTSGLVNIPMMQRELKFYGPTSGGKPLSAGLLGLAFGFGWTPCIGPVLGAILTLAAVSATAGTGVILLSAYSLGLGIPFILSAMFADALAQRLTGLRNAGRILKIVTGLIMVIVGIAMITGHLQSFAFWLLETFPIFQRIG